MVCFVHTDRRTFYMVSNHPTPAASCEFGKMLTLKTVRNIHGASITPPLLFQQHEFKSGP